MDTVNRTGSPTSGISDLRVLLKSGTKRPESPAPQVFDGLTAAHDPETARSSPFSAITKHRISHEIRCFSALLPRNSLGQNLGQPSDPSLNLYGKHFRKHQMDCFVRPSGALALFYNFFRMMINFSLEIKAHTALPHSCSQSSVSQKQSFSLTSAATAGPVFQWPYGKEFHPF